MSQEQIRSDEVTNNTASVSTTPINSKPKKSGLSLAERLGLVGYRNQSHREIKPHIMVDTDICNSSCPHQCTTWVCPTNCYTTDEDQKVHFQVEDCIECGTCMYACDQGAIDWNFPDPEIGRGVNWNFG